MPRATFSELITASSMRGKWDFPSMERVERRESLLDLVEPLRKLSLLFWLLSCYYLVTILLISGYFLVTIISGYYMVTIYSTEAII